MNTRIIKTRKPAFACTTMIAGKSATHDGSVLVAHSDDDVSDIRVIFVPAQDWDLSQPDQAVRPVYYDDCSLGHDQYADPEQKITYNATEFRRFIGTSRGPGYDTLNEDNQGNPGRYYNSIPLGSIPQVPHTYAYFDSSYGIMNEHQLMIGECTCGAKIHPDPEPGKRIFYSAELSRVALERCTKAREAVLLMGELIERYGYYGTGETLLVGDPDEAWVMEMCGYDPEGSDGLWVAQRVPDNGFFVAANQFRIRTIDESPTMLYAKPLKKICQDLGWWNPENGPLDWLPTVSFGEYSNPYYSLRRVWRALTKVKPSSNLSPWVNDGYTSDYPFCVIPDGKLSVAALAEVYRDHYEGTEFDMTVGRAAGPWGNPTRYENNPDQGDTFKLQVYCPHGAWERPISIYRCGMFWINQAKVIDEATNQGVSWIGLDRPASNCLIPFSTSVDDLPYSIQQGKVTEFNTESAWWAFNFVANYANLNYKYMMEDITCLQNQLETETFNTLKHNTFTSDELKSYCDSRCREIVKAWWRLSEQLIVKYNNGCITTGEAIMQKIDYPGWWLRDAGYYEGPVSYEKRSYTPVL